MTGARTRLTQKYVWGKAGSKILTGAGQGRLKNMYGARQAKHFSLGQGRVKNIFRGMKAQKY